MKSENLIINEQLYELRAHGTPLFSFATYRMVNALETLFVTSHWHRELEILCLQKGRASVLLNGHEYQTEAGDILFINPGELHQISSSDSDLLYHACDFPLSFLNFADADYAQTHFLDPLADKEMFFPSFISHTSANAAPIYHELLHIIQVHESKLPGYQLHVKGSLLKIISYLIQHQMLLTPEALNKKVNASKVRQLKEIVSYIQAHYTDKLRLEEISDAFHMSGKYFSRYFKQNFGVNFVDYLNNFRIEKACTLLTSTDISIMEISFATGFHNFSYFIRKFKAITGLTPSEYRAAVTAAGDLN